MKILPITFALIAVSALHAASAEEGEIRWSAKQWAGPQWDCSESSMNTRWTIVEKDGLFVATSETFAQIRINTRSLRPDGSGRVTIKDARGRLGWVEFEAGHGPRKIYFNSAYHACVWLLYPL